MTDPMKRAPQQKTPTLRIEWPKPIRGLRENGNHHTCYLANAAGRRVATVTRFRATKRSKWVTEFSLIDQYIHYTPDEFVAFAQQLATAVNAIEWPEPTQ